ncbi:MAG TPA: hypothetical protein VK497_03710 [Candidatus Saccharimonadales bacterium]|nr:hypothetical protein [Candidatus Saccharimonadales bacterium]
MSIEGAVKTPETFHRARLIAEDFDDTAFRTFEKSPSGVGVAEAYTLSIEDMFGSEALSAFLSGGGLRNRAPIEVVQQLAPDAKNEELNRLVQELTETKLNILMGEIGTRFLDGSLWPRPTEGYLDLCAMIEAARQEGQLIDDAIISSGHEPFIEKTFKVWSIDIPTHVIATETTQRIVVDLEEAPENLIKPSPLLMGVARSMWAQGYGVKIPARNGLSNDEKRRIVYVGDDLVKDGGLAENSGVAFELIDPANSGQTWQRVASRLQIGNFNAKNRGEDV